MKKAILISIRPEWVKKIINGEKTIEIRKTMPKCELPIEVYVYCSHGKRGLYVPSIMEKPFAILDTGFVWLPKDKYVWKEMKPIDGKVVAKFTLSKIERVVSCVAEDWGDDPREMRYSLRLEESDAEHLDDQLMCEGGFEGEVINPVYDYLGFDFPTRRPDFGTRPDFKEGIVYGYAWHISDLQVFDEPKELSDFGRLLGRGTYSKADYLGDAVWEGRGEVTIQQEKLMAEKLFSINRAPQGWQYVEVEE